MSITVVKHDPSQKLLDEGFVRDFLDRNGHRMNLSGLELSEYVVRPLKVSTRGGKSVIELELRLVGNRRERPTSVSLVAKWRRDGGGRRHFALLQELWAKEFDGRDGLSICQPLAYFPAWQVLLTSKAKGVELAKLLEVGRESVASPIEWAGRWLAKLHSAQATHVTTHTMRQEEQELGAWQRHLGRLHPRSSNELRRVLSRVLESERSLEPRCFRLIHGDFHPDNIIVDGSGLTVIDLEQASIFDPARDLGYFVAQLVIRARHHGLQLDTAALEGRFLSEYAARMSSGALGRVAEYEARAYLQHLHFDYWVLKRRRNPADFEYWVTRAREALDGDAPDAD